MQITEQWILSHAPGPAVADDGRAISDKDRFLSRCRSGDALTYWGVCAGSARNPYYVSVDWSLSEKEPAYSCSCPSRHFPCKHALALLYDILAEKPFDIEEPPPYVLKVRARQARERARAEARLERTRKYDAAVKEKKLERQFDGLAKAEKLSDELLAKGIPSVSELPSQALERLAAELGNCDLPAARDAVARIAQLERQRRQDGAEARRCYAGMLHTLAALRALIGQSRKFLDEQRSSGSYAMDNPLLYETLGGVWNPDELREIGSYRKNARLVQLSFDVIYDEARRTYRERGFWLELTRGDLVQTLNVRPAKALTWRTDDSFFDLLEVPVLYESPVAPYPCVWWENAVSLELTAQERAALLGAACERIAEAVEHAKARLKNPLLPGYVPALLSVGSVGYADGTPALADRYGGRIVLRDWPADGAGHASVRRLTALSAAPAEGDALFGLLFYDEEEKRICLHPYSLVTAEQIVRLQY